MYPRTLAPLEEQSYFLLGPRGTGKSSFVGEFHRDALLFDLLDGEICRRFLAAPERLGESIPESYRGWVVVDEIQKIPSLLDEVHRLIEGRKLRFVLTGSSARKLKSPHANLLAGRAFRYQMYPLTVEELGEDFDLEQSLNCGHLPQVFSTREPKKFLQSYVQTYLREEIQSEALSRNLPAFSRFLEAAAFSQGSPLVISSVARDCSVARKVVENYFTILRDTLISYELPVFTKRAKRKLLNKVKFYFFDVGVFRTLRTPGVLDSDDSLSGIALETLILQEMMAQNGNKGWDYNFFYWRTARHWEVDFVLYGERGFKGIEVKASTRIRGEDFKGLLEFKKDYPECELFLVYRGERSYSERGVRVVGVRDFFSILGKEF